MTRMNVDLRLLRAAKAPQVFMQIDSNLRPRLERMSEVFDRIEGCLYFCYLTSAESVGAQRGETSLARERQKFIRAALCEFGSILDAAVLDFNAAGKQAPPLGQLRHPQIHVVRLLRHANVHLAASTLTRKTRPAIWPGPDGDVEFEHAHYVVADISSTVRSVIRARDYTEADLSGMLYWLENEQREWGIANVVHRTAEVYGEILADAWDRS